MDTALQSIEQLAQIHLDDLLNHYHKGVIDPVQVHDLTVAQIERVNPEINALYDLNFKATRLEAEASAKRWKTSSTIGALDGIPVSIKDSIHAVGMHWHHGSAAHAAGHIGKEDAPPVEKLKQAGAIILAKSTMPDYGMSASGLSSYHGIIRNPWSLYHSPGGSSAGAGASLAAGIGLFAVGSDIAGSVRLPASHCGLAAIKPTQGMLAHTPASDIRSAGIMARSAQDLLTPFKALGGLHPRDRFSVPILERALFAKAKVKCYADFGFGPNVDAEVLLQFERACQCLAQQGMTLSAGDFRYSFDAYAAIDDVFKLRAWNEYQQAPADYRDQTPEKLIDWFKPAATWNARKVCQFQADIAKGIEETQQLFADADYLITPVMTVVNFPATQLGPDENMPLRHCTFTAPFNQSGHPAVVIHAGLSLQGLPLGIQLVAKRFDDLALIALAVKLENSLREQGVVAWPTQPYAGIK